MVNKNVRKNVLKFFALQIITTLVVAGCSEDTTQISEARILIGYGSEVVPCIINVNSDGTVEYISGDVEYNDLFRETIEKNGTKKVIRFSKKDKVIVNEMINEISSGESVEYLRATGFVKIIALIGNKEYYSVYGDYGPTMNWYYDHDLADLCYKLVEIAPLKVGGNDNPLKVPET